MKYDDVTIPMETDQDGYYATVYGTVAALYRNGCLEVAINSESVELAWEECKEWMDDV